MQIQIRSSAEYKFSLSNFRNCTTSLKECVPLLTSYAALKAQFDWLTDGGISRLVDQNLGPKLKDLELYIRY